MSQAIGVRLLLTLPMKNLGVLEHVFQTSIPTPLTVRGINLYGCYCTFQHVRSQMYFNHYTNKPVELAVRLVNTPEKCLDELTEIQDLLDDYTDIWDGVALPLQQSELPKIHRIRTSLREVLTASDTKTCANLINEMLSRYGAVPRISLHTDDPHLHFEPVNSTMTSFLGTTTAMGLASVIVEHGTDRFGECGASDCNHVYVDTSRNRSRRHCSNTCSTREAVAAHRRRKSG